MMLKMLGADRPILCPRKMYLLVAFLFVIVQLDHCARSFTPSITRTPLRSLSPPLFYARGDQPVISSIQSPEDLKQFVVADDRLAVVKVYADWCKTCKQFDLRYRKVVNDWGGNVRFAQMEYTANEEMCKLLGATKIPYILIYKREGGKLAGFTCPPSKVQLLVDALHNHIDDISLQDVHVSHSEETEFKHSLSEGAELMHDIVMPEIKEEAGYSTDHCRVTFEQFCTEHTRQKS